MNDYRIVFEFRNGLGVWVWDCLDNNGEYFTKEEAQKIMEDLRRDEVCVKRCIYAEHVGA